MPLIVPGGRPSAVPSDLPVDYAFVVAVEKDGDISLLEPGSIRVSREPTPDDVYGALAMVVDDGPHFFLGDTVREYEFAFMVVKLTVGKALLAPSLDVSVKPLRNPSTQHVYQASYALMANIQAMKSAEMLMQMMQAQAQAIHDSQIVGKLING